MHHDFALRWEEESRVSVFTMCRAGIYGTAAQAYANRGTLNGVDSILLHGIQGCDNKVVIVAEKIRRAVMDAEEPLKRRKGFRNITPGLDQNKAGGFRTYHVIIAV